MEKMKNKTSQEIFDEYSLDFATIEDSWYELTGAYPTVESIDFWESAVVRKLDTLICLWWDLKELRAMGDYK